MGPNPQGVVLPADIFRVLALFAGAGACSVLVLVLVVGWLLRRLSRARNSDDGGPVW